MKHVILFEDFDLEKFLNNPEEFFHDDTRPEIEEGDYITCYRGTGQVLELGPVFGKIQLFDGPKTVVQVPIENLTKLNREEAKKIMGRSENSQRELKKILDDLDKFADVIETTSDQGEEKLSGNLEATVEYLEEILTDILAMSKSDPFTTQYQDYSNLVGLVARISHFIMEQSEQNPDLQNRTALVLDKFYEILD